MVGQIEPEDLLELGMVLEELDIQFEGHKVHVPVGVGDIDEVLLEHVVGKTVVGLQVEAEHDGHPDEVDIHEVTVEMKLVEIVEPKTVVVIGEQL